MVCQFIIHECGFVHNPQVDEGYQEEIVLLKCKEIQKAHTPEF